MKVIIAHSETRGPLGDSHLGEVRRRGPSAPDLLFTLLPVLPRIREF